MKILTATSTRLCLRYCPIFNWLAFFVLETVFTFLNSLSLETLERDFKIFFAYNLILIILTMSLEINCIIFLDFDKEKDTLIIKKKNLLFSKQLEYKIKDIESVQIEKKYSLDSYSITVQLLDSEYIILYTDPLLSLEEAKEQAFFLADFLEFSE